MNWNGPVEAVFALELFSRVHRITVMSVEMEVAVSVKSEQENILFSWEQWRRFVASHPLMKRIMDNRRVAGLGWCVLALILFGAGYAGASIVRQWGYVVANPAMPDASAVA